MKRIYLVLVSLFSFSLLHAQSSVEATSNVESNRMEIRQNTVPASVSTDSNQQPVQLTTRQVQWNHTTSTSSSVDETHDVSNRSASITRENQNKQEQKPTSLYHQGKRNIEEMEKR